MGCSDKHAQKDASDTAAADQKAAEIRQQYEVDKQNFKKEDKPHFDWSKVDYTQAKTKVNIKDNQAIIKAVGEPIVEQEKHTNENGKSAITYYFRKNDSSSLVIT